MIGVGVADVANDVAVEQRVEAFVVVFMSPQGDVDSVYVEKLFEAVEERSIGLFKALPHQGVGFATVVIVACATVCCTQSDNGV